MELNEFVRRTLEDVMKGVADAAKSMQGGKVVKTATVQFVEFDVAVTVTEQSNTEGHAGISVLKLGFGGAKASESSNQSATRIKFSIPVRFPYVDG